MGLNPFLSGGVNPHYSTFWADILPLTEACSSVLLKGLRADTEIDDGEEKG